MTGGTGCRVRAGEGRRTRRGPWIARALGLAVLLLASSLPAGEGGQAGKKSFLWRVQSEASTVYLLGSIHMLRPDMYPLAREIEEAFDRSDVLVVEADIRDGAGGERQRRMLETAMYPPGDSIENHISKETADLLRKRFPELSMERVGRFKPWALAMTIAVLEYRKMGMNYEHGIDVYFLGKAKDGKRVREIERPDSVIAMLDGFSDEYQDLFLQYTLLDLEKIGGKADRILRAWSGGDAAAMERIITESVRERPRLMPVFEALFYRRNEKMAERIEEYLGEKGVFFVVVGAGHMVGEDGIVELLRKKGFGVEQR